MTTLLIINIVARITACAAEMAAEEVRYRIAREKLLNKIVQNNRKRAEEFRKILSDNKDLEAN